MPGPSKAQGAAVLLAIALVLLVLYPEAILRGHVFASADAGNAAAFAEVGNEALAAGDYPLWNPYLFAGMPTFGSLAYTRWLYPPSGIFDFLQNTLGFPPLTWMIVHLLLGGLGMAWLLAGWRLPPASQALGATAWLLMPIVVSWAVHGHGSKLVAAMYLPWILGLAWRVLMGGGALWVGLLGLALGLQVLRGHVQITYYTLLAVGWLALLHGVWGLRAAPAAAPAPARRRWRGVALVAGGLALGFLVGAALLVPVNRYAKLSVRGASGEGGADYEYATGWSLAPRELPTLVLPSAAGFGRGTYAGEMPFTDYPNYVGFLLLAFGAAAWAGGRRRLPLALASLALLSLLVSFGRHSALYNLLYEQLPFFNRFRVPSMILVLLGAAAAALGAAGAAALGRTEPAPGRWLRAWSLGLAGLGGLLFLLGAAGLAEGPYTEGLRAAGRRYGRELPLPALQAAWDLHRADLVRIGLLLLAAAAALLLARRRDGFRRGPLPWALAALVAADLLAVDWRIVRPERSLIEVVADAEGRARLVPAARLLEPWRPPARGAAGFAALAQEVGHERVWPLGPLALRNDLMPARIRSLGGYHPAKLAAYETIRRRLQQPDEAGQRIAGWLAGAVAAAGAPPDLRTAPNPAAVPRARLLSRWALADTVAGAGGLETFLDRLGRGGIDYRERVTLDRAPDPAPAPAAGALSPPEFVRDGMDEVVLRTTAPAPAILVLADMHAPGWRVEVDGRPAELLRADLVLRAVALPAGEHTVRFAYGDPSVRTGLGLSLAGTLLSLGLIVLGGLRDRRRRGAAGPAPAAAGREEA